MSSGMRTLLSEVLAYAFFALAAIWAINNFEVIKTAAVGLGLQLPQSTYTDPHTRQPQTQHAQVGHKPVGYVELPADNYGHYQASVEVNGRTIRAMVDTGATVVAMSHRDARRAGITVATTDYTSRVRTANCIARVAPVTLSRVRIGDIVVRNVRGVVSEPGKLNGTLLGMSFLSRLSRFEIRSGRLILQE